ncbi:MAG: PHA/PHB synthase family protein [Rhodopila sp.]
MARLWTSWLGQIGFVQDETNRKGISSPADTPDLLRQLASGSLDQVSQALNANPWLKSIDQIWNANPLHDIIPLDWSEIARSLRFVWLRSAADPAKSVAAVTNFNLKAWQSAVDAWAEASRRWVGAGPSETGSARLAADKRFAAAAWHNNPIYQTLRELYLLASDWLLEQGKTSASSVEPVERQRINFHLRQFVDAMSPALLLAANPEALHRMIETGGASLADGARNLMQDLREGRLSMVDATAFAPGRNLALTPGKVVYRNKLIELIQYAPQTDSTYAVPLLILPPWINKYYILDMQPKNSLVRYLVSQGFTVFMVSWKNPDASMEETSFEDYMELGPLTASDVVREITGTDTVNVMGYCIGGTLLAMTLAWLAARGENRFRSASFMVSLMDFSRVGDTAVFLGEPGVDFVEQQMMERGYLDSREMSNMFNLLRSNDLIWSNVVNNYLLGQKPPAFDLLYWNSDGTRMARAAHSWYLRNTYVENNLIKPGHIHLKGEALDLGRIRLDTYAVGAEKDHIVPWDAAWRITQLFGGRVRFVRASSGHIAGIINPPGGRGTYWVAEGDSPASSPQSWLEGASHHDGSWWTDWSSWLAARSGQKSKAPAIGSSRYSPLQDAPGSYVMEK